jgi:WD40 repeat protein
MMKKTNIELVGRHINVIESQYIFNQIKLMNDGSNTYLTAVDDGGYLHTINIKYSKKTLIKTEYKKFNCKIDYADNSTWSLDCHYPFVAVGGNHQSIVINNIHDESVDEIKNNIVLDGNQHNIPCVSFSPDGEFIGCSSIDSIPKIYDMHYGNIIKKIDNRTKDWGWGIKFIVKSLFRILNEVDDAFMNDIEFHPFIRTIIDGLKISLHRPIEPLAEEEITQIDDPNNDIKQDIDYYKLFLSNCLQKYIYVTTYKNSIYITGYEETSDKISQINFSKFNPLINYIKLKYRNINSVTYATLIELKHYIEYSRYEYILISEAMNKLILGNKQGDINIYEMDLYFKDGKLQISTKPITIIDFNFRIAGIRIVDYIDKINPENNYFNLFIVGLNGYFECYKFKNKIN